MSFHDRVSVTFVLYCMRSFENTQSARTWPARHTSRFSEGLFTLEAVWPPTSCVAASPPDLYGRYANLAPVLFSMKTVRTGSSRFQPVPPIFNIWSDAPPAPAATTISTGLVGSHENAGAAARPRLAATIAKWTELGRLTCMAVSSYMILELF